ncbi:unnamed protein product [Cuscuta campestris]|uniref:RNase H type-1 domain-containing protein n=1 Tax=Cuscuta campestris TaxID=132261 RepID=A0A484L0M4_9ASTE|nr:unnamed protein product [Cuscuta campestris]
MEELKRQIDRHGSFGPTVEVISPFSARVMKANLPRGMKAPEIHYKGVTDPNDHLAAYQTHMLMHAVEDEIQCRLFVGTLEGPAVKWFLPLPNGTIDCFKDLAQFFLNRGRFQPKKHFTHLFSVKQKEGETNTELVQRWNEAMNEVEPMDDKTSIALFMSILRSGELFIRILVDTGSSVNVLYWEAAQQLGVRKEDLKRLNMPLSGFTGDIIEPEGSIKLNVMIGEHPKVRHMKMDFVVVDIKAVGDQPAVKKAYLNACKRIDKENLNIQTIGQALEDKERKEGCRERPKPAVEMEVMLFPDGDPEKVVRIGLGLEEDVRDEIIRLLRENSVLFVWESKDMPGVDPSVIFHNLKIKMDSLPVKQKKRYLSTDRKEFVRKELKGEMEAKEGRLKKYRDRARTLLGKFEYYELIYVPREENEEADMLAKLCRTVPIHMESMVRQHEKTCPVWEEAVLVLEISGPSTTWMSPLSTYLEKGELPVDPKEARRVQLMAPKYQLDGGRLYKRTLNGPMLKCLSDREAGKILEEVYQGVCSAHQGALTLARKMELGSGVIPSTTSGGGIFPARGGRLRAALDPKSVHLDMRRIKRSLRTSGSANWTGPTETAIIGDVLDYHLLLDERVVGKRQRLIRDCGPHLFVLTVLFHRKIPSRGSSRSLSKSRGVGERSPRRSSVPQCFLKRNIRRHPKPKTPEIRVLEEEGAGNWVTVLEEKAKNPLKVLQGHHHKEAAKLIIELVDQALQELHVGPGCETYEPLARLAIILVVAKEGEEEIQSRLDAFLVASGEETQKGLVRVGGNLAGRDGIPVTNLHQERMKGETPPHLDRVIMDDQPAGSVLIALQSSSLGFLDLVVERDHSPHLP